MSVAADAMNRVDASASNSSLDTDDPSPSPPSTSESANTNVQSESSPPENVEPGDQERRQQAQHGVQRRVYIQGLTIGVQAVDERVNRPVQPQIRPQLLGFFRRLQAISLRSFIMAQMSSRVAVIMSFVATLCVIVNAFCLHKQFYPSIVYLTKSSRSMGILYVQAVVVGVIVGKLVTHVLFGKLHILEFETIVERVWFALTETMMAFTIFRDDLSPKFIGLFIFLLYVKSYHWLAEERIDLMERSPSLTKMFHFRLVSVLVLLSSIDAYMVSHALMQTSTKGLFTVEMVFGFEYAILCTLAVHVVVKYCLNVVDVLVFRQRVAVFEQKVTLLMYTELVVSFVRLMFYILFMAVLMNVYAIPLFTIRPVYLTLVSIKRALTDIVMSRKAIQHMNRHYPDATEQDLRNITDNTCIICRDEMKAGNVKKMPCSHIFHTSCLRSWFQRQQTCPTCRLDVLSTSQGSRTRPGGGRAPHNRNNNGNNSSANGQASEVRASQVGRSSDQPSGPSASCQQSSSQSNVGSSGASLPPMPPLPPSGWPVLPPMPDPPKDLATLTDAELAAMEADTRAGVEARIMCLQNVRILLDASVMQMHQYYHIVAKLEADQKRVEAKPKVSTPVSVPIKDLGSYSQETGSGRDGSCSSHDNGSSDIPTTGPANAAPST